MSAKPKRPLRIAVIGGTIALLLVIGALLTAVVFSHLHSGIETDLKYYERFQETHTFMPRLDELGNTVDLDFKRTRRSTIFYTSVAYLLTVSYDEPTYAAQKQAVFQKYAFEKEAATNTSGKSFETRFTTADGFDFRVLSLEKYGGEMPKRFSCIGVSDSEKQIVYLFFEDIDRDLIPSWEAFLRESCGWD